MVVTNKFAKLPAVSGAFGKAGLLVGLAGLLGAAAPAYANSSAADMSSPLRASQQTAQSASGGQDAQFRRLFSSWQNYEETGFVAVKPKADVAGIGSIRSMAIPTLVPVDYTRESSPFGLRDHPVLGGVRAHKGVDLAAPTGTPIHATADGVVERAQWVSGYGLFVEIEHGGDLETRYGHMSRLAVADGQMVHRGDVIGYVGQTGYATGPHLHYEVRVDGVAVDPTPYMQVSLASFEKSGGEAKGG